MLEGGKVVRVTPTLLCLHGKTNLNPNQVILPPYLPYHRPLMRFQSKSTPALVKSIPVCLIMPPSNEI